MSVFFSSEGNPTLPNNEVHNSHLLLYEIYKKNLYIYSYLQLLFNKAESNIHCFKILLGGFFLARIIIKLFEVESIINDLF